MTQDDRGRLVALRKAEKKIITQQQAAGELGLSVRHVKRWCTGCGGKHRTGGSMWKWNVRRCRSCPAKCIEDLGQR